MPTKSGVMIEAIERDIIDQISLAESTEFNYYED
jgi:hypothetical protein